MNLIYTFTKKLKSWPEWHPNFKKIVKVYNESYKNNIRFHNIILYTDKESAYLFRDTFDKIVLKEFNNILLLDDYKYNVLKYLNDDDILFDGDIFLTQKLFIDNNFELICDQWVPVRYKENYKYAIDLFLKNKIEDVIPFFKKTNYVPNIGILKFKDKTVEKEFLKYYWKMKDWFIDSNLVIEYDKFELNGKLPESSDDEIKIRPNNNLELPSSLIGLTTNDIFAPIFGQYLLGLFTNEKKINICFLAEKNIYSHFNGDTKFNISLSKNII